MKSIVSILLLPPDVKSVSTMNFGRRQLPLLKKPAGGNILIGHEKTIFTDWYCKMFWAFMLFLICYVTTVLNYSPWIWIIWKKEKAAMKAKAILFHFNQIETIRIETTTRWQSFSTQYRRPIIYSDLPERAIVRRHDRKSHTLISENTNKILAKIYKLFS